MVEVGLLWETAIGEIGNGSCWSLIVSSSFLNSYFDSSVDWSISTAYGSSTTLSDTTFEYVS